MSHQESDQPSIVANALRASTVRNTGCLDNGIVAAHIVHDAKKPLSRTRKSLPKIASNAGTAIRAISCVCSAIWLNQRTMFSAYMGERSVSQANGRFRESRESQRPKGHITARFSTCSRSVLARGFSFASVREALHLSASSGIGRSSNSPSSAKVTMLGT